MESKPDIIPENAFTFGGFMAQTGIFNRSIRTSNSPLWVARFMRCMDFYERSCFPACKNLERFGSVLIYLPTYTAFENLRR